MSELVGATSGERAPDERLAHRNAYRPRVLATRAGEIELAIPKIRRGSYVPSFLEPPDDRSLIRLAASVGIEQADEWLVGRRYLSNHSLSTQNAYRRRTSGRPA